MNRATSDEAVELISRMRALRSTGDRDVQRLQHEMDRVSDWREHVRARPAISAVAAGVIGFVVVRGLFTNRQVTRAPVTAAQTGKSPTASALGFVGGLVGSMARQMVTEYLKNGFKAGQNGNSPQSAEREWVASEG